MATQTVEGPAAVWKANTPFNPRPEGSGSETRPVSVAVLPRLYV